MKKSDAHTDTINVFAADLGPDRGYIKRQRPKLMPPYLVASRTLSDEVSIYATMDSDIISMINQLSLWHPMMFSTHFEVS